MLSIELTIFALLHILNLLFGVEIAIFLPVPIPSLCLADFQSRQTYSFLIIIWTAILNHIFFYIQIHQESQTKKNQPTYQVDSYFCPPLARSQVCSLCASLLSFEAGFQFGFFYYYFSSFCKNSHLMNSSDYAFFDWVLLGIFCCRPSPDWKNTNFQGNIGFP